MSLPPVPTPSPASEQVSSSRSGTRRAVRSGLALLLGMSAVVGLVAAGAQPASAADTTSTRKPAVLAFTNSAAPTTAYAGAAEVTFSASQYRTFLKYDTAALGSTAKIVSASLELAVTKSAATQPGIEVRTAATTFTSGVTYATRPSVTDVVLNPGSTVVPKANTTVDVKLTELAGKPVGAAMGFQLSYTAPGTPIRMSAATPPVLHLVTSTPTTTVTSTDLPYAHPPIPQGEKKVFAHYFPPYPISLDNQPTATDYYARHYLNPLGENSKFQVYGGLLRDRPEGRPVLTGDYKLLDSQTEVKTAVGAGVEGFYSDVMGLPSSSWTATLQMSQAAASSGTGFVVAPNLDMTSSIVSMSTTDVASYLAEFYKTPGAYRLPDGRFVLSTFKAENKPASWWQDLITKMKVNHGIDVAWIGIMLSLNDTQIASYAPIAYQLGVWGARDADLTMRMSNLPAKVHAAGAQYIAPIAVQDVRHTQMTYAENGNTDLLRADWSRAINDGADAVQLITWNDYSESTGFAPSANHGDAFLDVNGYYATRFKTRTTPVLTGDELVVTHRIQKFALKPITQVGTMSSTLAGSATAPRDTVEVLSILKAPATVTLTVGSTTKTVDAPAGVSTLVVPLGSGTISAKAVRSGVGVAAVTSPKTMVSSINYWDLQYYAATSRG